jgi:hypothetical protein
LVTPPNVNCGIEEHEIGRGGELRAITRGNRR